MRMIGLIWLAMVVVASGQEIIRERRSDSSKPGQFRGVGGEDSPRGALILLAEEMKRDFLSLCGLSDDWKTPVELRLGDPQPLNPIVTRLLEIDGQRKFILELHVDHGLDQERFRRAIFSLIIYDHALRGRSAPEASIEASPWLIDGLIEAVDWKRGKSDRMQYRALFESGGVFDLDELLSKTETAYRGMDAASRAAFRVSSGVLVMALLEQSDGIRHFQDFLREVTTFEGEMNLLLSRHFPGVNLSSRGLEKLWSLQLAHQGGLNSLTDVLGIRQSDEALDHALKLLIRNEEGLLERRPLSDWALLSGLSDQERMEAVRLAENELVRASYRCFPPYRQILSEYQKILIDLSRDKSGEVPERLERLAGARRDLLIQAEKGRDYLDWFEITRADQSSGEFKDYMLLKSAIQTCNDPKGRSTAKYLDQVNHLYER